MDSADCEATLTPEAQRIAIAEACGWTIHGTKFRVFGNPDSPYDHVSACHDLYGFQGKSDDGWIPDYLNDLNAMHAAEKTLTPEQAWQYVQLLAADGEGWCATAVQRAEAFLKTIGKWEQ